MPRLIIGTGTICFTEKDKEFTGQVARLIPDNEIIYIIKYGYTGQVMQDSCRIKRRLCDAGNKFIWVYYPDNNHNVFVQLIGEEIEKKSHLLTSTEQTTGK